MTVLKETKIARRCRSKIKTIECGEGLTEQSHKNECDINIILDHYTRTGFMKHAKQNEGLYDDFTSADFQRSMEVVANVKSLFEGLPSEVRKEFNQDPVNFLNYVQDPKNHESLAKRGILVGNDGVDITGAYSGAPQRALASVEVSSTGDSAQASESASAAPTGSEGGTTD